MKKANKHNSIKFVFNMLPSNFVQILDQEQQRKDMQYMDILRILRLSDYHYAGQQFGDSSYVGINTHISPSSTIKTIDHSIKQYFPVDTPKPTKRIEIDAKINNFEDLIAIINKYEYCEDTEYNIDLKALTKIKPELLELDSMIGLSEFKNGILNQLLYFVQHLHVGTNPDFLHTALTGPPGTGKTEIAMIMGRMYSKIGILKNTVFKKVTRGDLIAGYLGQTAIKTKKVIDECLGGCLFIDEAYSLANDYSGDSFSRECIDTLCESLSAHKGELMVIVAGYKDELNRTFFKANRGMESRFIWRFHLDNYSYLEMLNIFKKKIAENEWILNISQDVLENWFRINHAKFVHYGRDMELLFSYCKVVHGRRIYGQDIELKKRLTIEDIKNGFKQFSNHTNNVEKTNIYGLYV
jgi:SpoVK/Ycf46/Vps4 family AAA+-type ATPase